MRILMLNMRVVVRIKCHKLCLVIRNCFSHLKKGNDYTIRVVMNSIIQNDVEIPDASFSVNAFQLSAKHSPSQQ